MRRRARDLFPLVVHPDALDAAARAVVKGKRRRRDVAWFLFRRGAALGELYEALVSGAWRPQGFEVVCIRDPKPRVIARAPVLDRVVHTALVTAMTPALTRTLTASCVACRPGMGTHRAALALLGHARRHPWALHLDVRAYFPSVDLAVLRRLLRERIADEAFLALLDRVLDAGTGLYRAPAVRRWLHLPDGWPPPGRGLPVGAYTSQVLASWLYLDALDQHALRRLRVPGYLRYVDDLVLFGRSRRELEGWRAEIAGWLEAERGLRLKHPAAPVLSTRGTLDLLGVRIEGGALAPLPRVARGLAGLAAEGSCGRARLALRRAVAARVGLMMDGAGTG